jgi:hypothetical protein
MRPAFLNSASALSIVQVDPESTLGRWVFLLQDEEETEVYRSRQCLVKIEAIRERDAFHRKASETPIEYRTLEQRVALRAYFWTREPK